MADPESEFRTAVSGTPDAAPSPAGRPGSRDVNLSEWLDEYRNLAPDSVVRTVAEPEDGWSEEELLAPADRLHDTTPRWRERAERTGYGRPTTF